MPDFSDQCSPQEILLLTGAKAVQRLHGREDAVDLLRVSEQSRRHLRLALLFSLSLLILVVRDVRLSPPEFPTLLHVFLTGEVYGIGQ